jgi:hypothetical protein
MYEHVQKHKEKHFFPPSVLLRRNDSHRFFRGADAAGTIFFEFVFHKHSLQSFAIVLLLRSFYYDKCTRALTF